MRFRSETAWGIGFSNPVRQFYRRGGVSCCKLDVCNKACRSIWRLKGLMERPIVMKHFIDLSKRYERVQRVLSMTWSHTPQIPHHIVMKSIVVPK